MNRNHWKFGVSWMAPATLLTAVATAKRVAPKPVTPIVNGGIRYSADGDGRDQYVVAEDVATGNILWKTKIFHTHIKFWVEEDNQWIFITSLKLAGNTLLVRDEKERCYSLDLTRRKVRKGQCEGGFSQ